MRILWTLLATLLLSLTGSAQGDAQGKIKAQLFTRSADGVIDAVIKVDLAPGWHIYHTELGHPDAVGRPTTFRFGGEGITWDAPVLPEPERIDQSAFGDGVFILAHEGSFLVHATGKLAEGATGADASVALKGQVCDPSVCLLFGLDLTTSGSGDDALFETAAPAVEEQEPVPTEDDIQRGRADATLYTRVVDGEVRAVVAIAIQRGFHLYGKELGHPEAAAEPTTIELKGAGVEWGPVQYPEPHRQGQGFPATDGSGEVWTWAYEGDAVFHVRGKLTGSGEGLWGIVEGQTCDDNGCIPYREIVVSKGAGPDSYFEYFDSAEANSASGSGLTNGTELAASAAGGDPQKPLGAFLLVCIFGGLFTLLMPCTYPMIPITISFFTKQADARGGKILPLSLAYGAGIVLIFVAIGVIVGPAIVKFAQHWVTNLVIGMAFLYFALVLFGIINLQPPRALMKLAGAAQGSSGLGGVFLMGATLVITSFTCTAPIVGAILGAGASGGELSRVVLGMGVFGLTMAIPFVILSLVPGRLASIPSAGQWMNTLKFFLGFVEVAASMKFFSNMDVALNEGAKWLTYGPFLWAWVAIFTVAGLYLLGILRFKDPKGRPGLVRLIGGALTLIFALYLGLAARKGFPTDTVMAALAPPVEIETGWAMVEDDYDAARKLAVAEGKLLLVNFTGHT